MKANLILYEYCIQLKRATAAGFIKILIIARKRVVRCIYIYIYFFRFLFNNGVVTSHAQVAQFLVY